MNNRQLKYAAVNFVIWREGASVGWDCSALELAKATGFHVVTVCRHARKSGWPINRRERRRYLGSETTIGRAYPVDTVMSGAPYYAR